MHKSIAESKLHIQKYEAVIGLKKITSGFTFNLSAPLFRYANSQIVKIRLPIGQLI